MVPIVRGMTRSDLPAAGWRLAGAVGAAVLALLGGAACNDSYSPQDQQDQEDGRGGYRHGGHEGEHQQEDEDDG